MIFENTSIRFILETVRSYNNKITLNIYVTTYITGIHNLVCTGKISELEGDKGRNKWCLYLEP